MNYVQGCRRERIGNLERSGRYLLSLMVCAVDVEELGIVGFDESGGLGFIFELDFWRYRC